MKDALGITGIVGAGPIVAAAAELMRNSPRRLTCVRCVTDVSLSVTDVLLWRPEGVCGGLALGKGQGRVIHLLGLFGALGSSGL